MLILKDYSFYINIVKKTKYILFNSILKNFIYLRMSMINDMLCLDIINMISDNVNEIRTIKKNKTLFNKCIHHLNKVNENFSDGCKNPNNNFTLKMWLIKNI
mgnify:CR=1 FL=1